MERHGFRGASPFLCEDCCIFKGDYGIARVLGNFKCGICLIHYCKHVVIIIKKIIIDIILCDIYKTERFKVNHLFKFLKNIILFMPYDYLFNKTFLIFIFQENQEK